jgi:hypothetical protein
MKNRERGKQREGGWRRNIKRTTYRKNTTGERQIR